MITRGNLNVGFVLCLALVIWGFFLPWVKVESSFFNGLTRVAGGEESVVMKQFSGYDIPKVANNRGLKTVRRVAQIFVKDTGNIGLKSYAVYAIPAWGILLFWLFLWAEKKKKMGNVLVTLLAWSFSGFLAYKLLNIHGDKIVASAQFGIGLWLSLVAIAVMGLCAFFKIVVAD